MSLIKRSCTVCGAQTEGLSRCETHRYTAGGRNRACLTCGLPSSKNFCEEHQPAATTAQRRSRQAWRANYNTGEYRANRREALRRDNYRCVICNRGTIEGVRLEVDHVIALVDGGTNDVSNLVTLCADHHRLKTNQDRSRRRRR